MQRGTKAKVNSEMAAFAKSRDLISHTLLMTNNTRRYPKSMRFTLTNRIQQTAIDIYESLLQANEIFPKTEADKASRSGFQRAALTKCKTILFYIDLSLERGYINAKSAEYWSKMVLNVQFLTGKWLHSDRQRF